jgi:hypothetical protein
MVRMGSSESGSAGADFAGILQAFRHLERVSTHRAVAKMP